MKVAVTHYGVCSECPGLGSGVLTDEHSSHQGEVVFVADGVVREATEHFPRQVYVEPGSVWHGADERIKNAYIHRPLDTTRVDLGTHTPGAVGPRFMGRNEPDVYDVEEGIECGHWFADVRRFAPYTVEQIAWVDMLVIEAHTTRGREDWFRFGASLKNDSQIREIERKNRQQGNAVYYA
jgi:hypothetical protein